jgi:hypothetical protein
MNYRYSPPGLRAFKTAGGNRFPDYKQKLSNSRNWVGIPYESDVAFSIVDNYRIRPARFGGSTR